MTRIATTNLHPHQLMDSGVERGGKGRGEQGGRRGGGGRGGGQRGGSGGKIIIINNYY